MSTPSTPLRAASRGTSPLHSEGNEGETAILTPGRKIRALLARFDSDESDDGNIPRNLRNSTGLSKRRASVENPVGYNDEDEDDEDDDFPIAPRGRLAARLQAGPQAAETRGNRVQSLFNRSPTRLNEDDSAQENVSDASEVIPSSQRRQETTPCLSTPSRGERSHPTSSPLFVSQDSPLPRVSRSGYETSGSENESIRPQQRSRLKALVAQKKREREEREQQEAEQRAERARNLENARVQFTSDIEAADEDEDDDGESSRRLTQQSRPARKASKKAMLEMSRETQRMSRNMQLAHQATTKKKFTLNSFIERFNQKCNVEQLSSAPDFISESRDAALASSVNHSDNDHVELDRQSTPPTSPLPHLINDDDKVTTGDKTSETSLLRELLPALAQDLEALGALDVEEAPQKAPSPAPTKIPSAPTRKPDAERPTSSRRVRIQLSRQDVAENQKNDSDSDLEIVTSPAKARKLALFENFSAKSSAASDSLRRLKLLARITSPKKNRALTRADHEAWLLRQARIQAAQEREEKIAALRAKGVIIQTAEEKARLEDDVEDLMEKAREEAEEIARKEKAAKKKGDGEEIAVEIDSEEDLDYHENPDEGEEKVENSDEEEENDNFDEEDEVSDEDQVDGEGRADDQVHIDSGAEDKDALGPAYSQAEDPNHRESTEISQRRRKPKYVVSDDEDEEQATGIVQTPMKPQIPYLGRQETPLIGLSQAFAATLADGQDDDEEQDSLAVLRRMPEFDIGVGDFLEQGSQGIVQHTQQRDSGHIDLLADFTQTDARVLDSPLARTVSDMSQVPEPSQDVGFVMSPFDQRKRFLPSSTVDTVPLQNDESPMAKRPGRRLRRGGVQQVSDSEDNFLVKPSAFDVMRKAAKKPITPFDKKKSNAKEIVDEAAEESEDEYAGLGGASDDESGVEDELDLTMINDNSGEVVNERELAAFNAEQERQRDEGEVNKLLRDITTGALRRKRGMGDDLDLSDSDDERIAARRRAKQREFAKMRKALLADDKLIKLADDPKKQAFFKSIEDREMDEDLDFLRDEYGESGSDTGPLLGVGLDDSQSNSEESGKDGRKRPLDATGPNALNRPPAKLRRKSAAGLKKPSTLAEIRAQLSSLIGEPEQQHEDVEIVPDSQPDPTSENQSNEDDDDGEDPLAQPAPTRSTNPRRRGRVVDRLSLRRAASSNAALSAAAAGAGPSLSAKLAFHSSTTAQEFKRPPPLLLRRTTTSSTSSSTSSSGTATPAAGGVVKSGNYITGKKGAVNYYAAAREKARELQLKRSLMRESMASKKAMEDHRASREKGLTGILSRAEWE